MTLLAGELYLLRLKRCDQVEVYDTISYHLLRCLTVSGICSVADMTSCKHYRCVYIGDHISRCVHSLDEQGSTTSWNVSNVPSGLSVNGAHNVMVTCRFVRKVKEFSSHGDLLRVLTLPDDVINPFHAIQTRSGQFLICHGDRDDPVHRVCTVSSDGRHIVHSHGGQRGPNAGQYDVPRHLAVDDNEFVFVSDLDNRRVTLLSPTLEYVRQVVSPDQLNWRPRRLYLDTERKLFYVADNKFTDGWYKAGRVVAFNV